MILSSGERAVWAAAYVQERQRQHAKKRKQSDMLVTCDAIIAAYHAVDDMRELQRDVVKSRLETGLPTPDGCADIMSMFLSILGEE